MVEATTSETRVSETYLPGFANHVATEAVEGALPVGRNSPQKTPFGLYAEQFSGSAFTAPRAENRRNWFYRMRPTADHAPFVPYDGAPLLRSGPFDEVPPSPNRLRWDPLPLPDQPIDFVDGLVTYGGNVGIAQRFNRFELTAKGDAQRTAYQDSQLTDGTTASNKDRNYNQYGVTLRGATVAET